jgi:hypothetical protein
VVSLIKSRDVDNGEEGVVLKRGIEGEYRGV